MVYTRKFVLARGDGEWRELTSAMSSPDRQMLEGLLSLNQWYPLGLFNRLARELHRRYHGDAVQELSRYIASEDLSFVFKMLLKMGSPEFLLKRANSVFSRYFEGGQLTSTEDAPRKWRLFLEAPTDEEAGPSEIICSQGVSGWITEGLVRTGADNGTVRHRKCRHLGAARCEYHAEW